MMELWKLEIFYSALSFSFLANNNVIKDERYLALLLLLAKQLSQIKENH